MRNQPKLSKGQVVQLAVLFISLLVLVVLLVQFPWSMPSNFRCVDSKTGHISVVCDKSESVDGYILFSNGVITEMDNLPNYQYDGENHWRLEVPSVGTYRLQLAAYKVVFGIKLIGPKTRQSVVIMTN